MTTTTKAVLITAGILLISATAVFAFRKKKPVSDAIKKVGSIVWPEGATESSALNEDGTDVMKSGTSGRYVEQLQGALNDLHKAAVYINNNCNSIKWAVFTKWQPTGDGNILPVTGTFDSKTAAVSQLYLNRQEVDLEFLELLKKKISAYKGGDKCVYPLGISV